ncbi:MAG: pyridoxamine 5'-phosphate oxidase family protein, partial [Pseudomonadota bacterium]
MQNKTSVFHEGEIAIHRELGIEDRMQQIGERVIRTTMPEQHQDFFALLPMIHLGALDSKGQPHAITRVGTPGFVFARDAQTLVIEGQPLSSEPDDLDLSPGAKLSVVGIEFETRRRNRVNAIVAEHQNGTLSLTVDQSYGNCPKYIQARRVGRLMETKPQRPVEFAEHLESSHISIIEKSDTLLIASRSADLSSERNSGVDINHRGGNPGFVKILNNNTLEFADYVGNNFFNTHGNLRIDGRVGIQVLEFESGDVLHLTGKAQLAQVK